MARSKEFDVNKVLRKAMELFWQQGYEKTSMQELVEIIWAFIAEASTIRLAINVHCF